MFERNLDLLSQAFDTLINSIYIGLLVYSYLYAFNKPTIDHLIEKVSSLEYKQDILHQAIQKLQNIISIDYDIQNKQMEQLKKIQKEINSIKQILDSNQLKCESDTDTPVSETEEYSDDTIPYTKNKPALPLQNHIKFPNLFILNDNNFKQTKLTDDTYELRFIGDDLRLISNQLAKFLKVKSGTCMDFDEAYELVFNYLQDNDIINIADDSKLCKLFGINENEDYENSDSILIKFLKKILEPHLKKITYECNIK